MFVDVKIHSQSKAEFYHQVLEQETHLIAGESDEVANLSNLSALLRLHLEDINWVGFYIWHERDNELVLGPFQGKPACIRIAPGRGVCGTAVTTQQIQIVADVFQFPGHIACDSDSRSEVVIPMLQAGKIIGVLDVDSPNPNRFDADDALGLQRIVDVLIAGTVFSRH